MNDSEIRAKAQELIQRFGIKTLPVDPFSIADKLNISVRPKPCNQEGGISGALLRSGNDFGILYATNIPNVGYQKFTVAHEIGHFVLDGHMEHLQLSDGDIHYSTPGFYGDKYEREANCFAACLLMPETLFTQAMSANDDGMESIKNLVEKCETSLTATAIRYIEETESMSAVVVSEKDRILYSLFSKEMSELKKVKRPAKNMPLPAGSLTYEINQSADSLGERVGDINMLDWLNNGFDVKGKEEVVRLGNYEKTLTLLTFCSDHEEILEDERMVSSWEPRFGR